MIRLLAALAVVSPMTSAAQDPQMVEELRGLAKTGPDSALLDRARHQPNDAREALRLLLAQAAGSTSDSAQLVPLRGAQRVAGAIAVAWQDSFPLRQVERFRSLSPARRIATVVADSLARAGRAAFGAEGVDVAMRILREALKRFEALADTSGIASALNLLGSGFYNTEQHDSAVAYLTRAREYAERVGDLRTLGAVLRNLGRVSLRQEDLGGARASFTRAQQVYQGIGDTDGLRLSYNNFGLLALSSRDSKAARDAFEAGLTLSRSGKDTALFLGNLARVAEDIGDYTESSRRAQQQVSIYRKNESWPELAGALRNLGVITERRGDYPGAIKALSEALAILRRIAPGTVMTVRTDEIDVRTGLASTRARMGDLDGARAELERAEAYASRKSGTVRRASLYELALAWGDLEARFNRLGEAERQYTRARRLASGEDADLKRAQADWGLASVLFTRGSYRRAKLVFEQLLSSRSLDSHQAAMVRLNFGEAAWRSGDIATARQAFTEVLDTVRAVGNPGSEAEALRLLGALEREAGRPLAAESLYHRGLARLRARPDPDFAWQLHGALAASLRSRGELADAARELLAGIAEIERVSGALQLEEQRSAFQADKWDLYVDLAMVEYSRGRTEAALEASERLRGRQMLDLLARGRVGGREQLRELSAREQDLRRKIGELTREAEASPEASEAMRDPAPAEVATRQATKELAQLQKDYGELLLQIRQADPSYAALVRGEIVPARVVMAGLAPNEALLEYLVGDSTTIVFIVTADTVAALDLKVGHDVLAAQVDFARSTLATATQGATRRAWRPALRRLYRQLVTPVEASGLLDGKRRLLIAPHAELHYLPFSALVGAGPPEQQLIERYLIEYVPSASVWLRLRDRPEPGRRSGVLALAPRAKLLPGSRAEVAAIRRIYGDRAQTLVGAPATERAFRDLAPQQGIVHLATYGVLNKHNPLFSFVEMAPGGGEDGRLEVHEVFGLTLNARLLVLSACQTGLGAGELADVPPGDDWVGLVQGFLYAGASNVVATLWPVSDVATARLMERFYRELAAGRPEAEALALAQRSALSDPTTAHPFFWAGFALIRGR
jgi:CHAT domain-containing protein